MSVVINGDTGISGVNGSAATPAIQGGDADTGIFFGTNEASISTGGSSRIHVDSSGRVGISTTSPGKLLSLQDSTTPALALYTGSNIRTELRATTGLSTLFSYSNSPITFNVGGSAETEALRIDSSARLLVGHSTPISGSNANDNFQLVNVAGSIASIATSDTTIALDTRIGEIQFWGLPGSTWGHFGTIGCFGHGTASPDDNPGYLLFSTTKNAVATPTARFKIDSDGRVDHFADDANCYDLHTPMTSGAKVAFALKNDATGLDDGTLVMRIQADGDLENTNNTYTSISDVKFKENIVDAQSQWQDVKETRVVNFNFKEEFNWGTDKHIGVVAQEIEAVSPGLICEREDENGEEYKSVAYSVLYMKAFKALQEAMERIETLEQRLADAGIA